MATRYVPLVAVMPKHEYDVLIDAMERVELPADLRDLLVEHGWTQEMVLLGRILSERARGLQPVSRRP